MKIRIEHKCPDFKTYRAACVKSLFNVETGHFFNLEADLPIEGRDWRIGLVVGPSGSGKSSIGREIFGRDAFHDPEKWPHDKPIIEAIAPEKDWQAVTGALSAVGLGSVPSWLRPYPVLSTGEKFRAELARIVMDAPERIVIDEFTSVVDRQIAKIGASAFAKAWRRTGGQAVLLSCHYDIVEWLSPDWVYDTGTGEFHRRRLRRPDIRLDVYETNWRFWPVFEPHHYLKMPHMIAAKNYIGVVDDTLVAHMAVSTRAGMVEARACRLVVMPEWQGAGVGIKFLDSVCLLWRKGENPYKKPMPVLFHTSHPGLAGALRRRPGWCQVSANLFGGNKARSTKSIAESAGRSGRRFASTGYGGHFRAVQGFRFLGVEGGGA